MVNRYSWFLLVMAILIALALHLMPGSTYRSPEMMDIYFGNENSPGSWTWEHLDRGSWAKEWEPFKYRIVFRGLIDFFAGFYFFFGADHDLQTYWLAFLTVSVAAHTFAIWACDRFLEAAGLGKMGRLAGVIAWLLLPPILFAYMLPVQTKEDFLAYGLGFLAFRAMLRGDYFHVVMICFFGAFVRETLLVLAGIFLIGTDAPRRMKIAALVLPIGVHLALRFTLGMNGYQIFRETNLVSIGLPIAAFAFIFGYGWFPLTKYLLRANLGAPIIRGISILRHSTAPVSATLDQRFDALRSAFPYALVLLLIAHFFMGRIQEIRITALLSPYVLLALIALFRDLSWSKKPVLVGLIASSATAMLIVALEALDIVGAFRVQINPMIAEFANQKWWAMAYLQIILMVGIFAAYSFARRTTPAPK